MSQDTPYPTSPVIATGQPNYGWIGVDLDGTLAYYNGWQKDGRIGDPIPTMVARVKAWLDEGKDIRIFTARVAIPRHATDRMRQHVDLQTILIEDWCERHIGRKLPVTCQKDYACIELWDDRAVQVIPNTGTAFQMSRNQE